MMIGRRSASLAALVPVACAATELVVEPAAGSFELTMGSEVDGQRYRYLLEVPPADERPEAGWPLLIFLHGAGERGDDLARVDVHGPPKLLDEIPELGRCILAAPQCPEDQWWQPGTLTAFLAELDARPDVDKSRIYLTGLSMGGYGTWDLLAAHPQRFAAAVPICGGGQTARLWPNLPNDFEVEDLLDAKDVPIRAYHGANDPVIPAEESRILVEALEGVGAEVELIVYPDVGHDSWTRTYADPDLYTWLFAQSR